MIDKLRALIQHPRFETAIIVLIVINAITLGLETSPTVMAQMGGLLLTIDNIVLTIFVAEILARIAVKRGAFFRDPWSLFDLFVVAIALVPASDSLSVLRALRILRVLRLVTAVPALRRVVGGLISALPGMGSIGLLLGLIFYVFAVIVTKLYGQALPDHFGSIGASAYTLFQAMTFDDWSGGIVKPLAEKGFPFGWFIIITFMVLTTFMALNLFIGVVVTALDAETDDGQPKLTHPAGAEAQLNARLDTIVAELALVRGELARLQRPPETGGA
ncbi:ion transporter [Phreatobacter sp.]|uniref:ion transporter n=1 Tax=Phreatobacter sp. TaxID=1966341 RepID=UPI003458AC89